jgi:multiple sugar transport system ATP-binding protein
LKHIQRRLETTTIYVTHDQIEAMTLADRIAIMNKGKIQQLGTPDEVYNNPANVFVAGFIGSPPMNLIKGDLENGTFSGASTRVEGLGKGSRKGVILGVRPEDITVAEAGQGNLNSTLYSLEPTGDQTLVAAFAGEQMVVAKCSRSFRQELDTPISLGFDTARCYLFDAESGERI